MPNGMANYKIAYRVVNGIPDEDSLLCLKQLYKTIFDDADLLFFEERIRNKSDVISIIAIHDKHCVGFKIGYYYDDSTFYSWVGGVLESHRNKGIGKEMASLQEHYAREKDYKKLRTKSMNRFKSMMILNLKNGFDIKSIYTNNKGQTKVVFEKEISSF